MTSRRDFIKNSLSGAAGIAVGGTGFSALSYSRIMGANERVNLAVIGFRGQGQTHINSWCSLKDKSNVLLKTICDVDENLWAASFKKITDKIGSAPATEWDMRKVFDDKDIHAVSCATPNHWHALCTIWAAQAGKHVYVEKPVSHNIWEGRKMMEAAQKYKVRVQSGLQNRSIANVRQAIRFLHEGGIGKVYMARGLCYKPRNSFGISQDSQPPKGLHYDMWLGPAAWRQYNEKKGHYNWHWHWDTGNGDTGNQGPHQFDIARWGLNKNEHPESVYSYGGLYGIDPKQCSQETPNTQTSLFKYADGTLLEFETRGRSTNGEGMLDITIGNLFYGTEGRLEIDGSTWKAFRNQEKEAFAGSEPVAKEPADPTRMAPPGGSGHYGNFIEAIRSGKDEDLRCHITEGFLSSALPLMANISYRTQRELKFDGKSEKFVNDKEANALLTRVYRKPYIITEEV